MRELFFMERLMRADSSDNLCLVGCAGLDVITKGGLPKNPLYLIQGEPGTGKITLVLQLLLGGVRRGEKCLYISFSETLGELNQVAKSRGWDLSGVSILELSALENQLQAEAQSTVFYPSEVEMTLTTDILLKEVDRIRPSIVVFDSISEMRMLAQTPIKYRRLMLSLKQFFTGRKRTALLLNDLTASPDDLQVQSVVHGVINLQKIHAEFGVERRRMNIVKLRGVGFTGGYHDYTIESGVFRVFPRFAPPKDDRPFKKGEVSSGISELDELLGGGLDTGSSRKGRTSCDFYFRRDPYNT
jgi:circadian clock protein KaiC